MDLPIVLRRRVLLLRDFPKSAAYTCRDRSISLKHRLGGEAYAKYGAIPFETVEDDLAREYRHSNMASRLDWQDARPATKAAWSRILAGV